MRPLARRSVAIAALAWAAVGLIILPSFADPGSQTFQVKVSPQHIQQGDEVEITGTIKGGSPNCNYAVSFTVSGPGGTFAASASISTGPQGNGHFSVQFPDDFSGANSNTPGTYTAAATFTCGYSVGYSVGSASDTFVIQAENERADFRATLNGFQQVPTLISSGKGSFTATLSDDGTMLTYTLTYSGLTGVTAAHIHLGATGTNGGVAVFLCGGGGKPACPASAGTVTGTITSANVLAIPSQGLAAGNFAGLLSAMKAGVTYANVHTTAFPAGEIRGQISTVQGAQDNQGNNSV